MTPAKTTFFDNLDSLANSLRDDLKEKKYILLFAYNGIGKTRLSMAFKDIGKPEPLPLQSRFVPSGP